MAKLILPDLYWEVTTLPEEARWGPDMAPLTNRQLQQVVFPGQPFTMVFPASRYGSNMITERFNPEGIPVTVADLLNTIYEFYQQPITQADIRNVQQDEEDVLHLQGAENLGDLLGGLIDFSGIWTIGENHYELNLEG